MGVAAMPLQWGEEMVGCCSRGTIHEQLSMSSRSCISAEQFDSFILGDSKKAFFFKRTLSVKYAQVYVERR